MLLVDKPAGPTSHDVVAATRRIMGQRRVGHAGTLDPPASGLLVVLVGRATRLARFVAMLRKSYLGTVRFGWETATDDSAGPMVGEVDDSWRAWSAQDVERALARIGERTEQMPPAVSAKKVAGQRAYRIARGGLPPGLAPVPIAIHALTLRRFDTATGQADIVVECSSGTYVRAIARDLGRDLGSRAHLAGLRRTAIGPWSVDEAVALAELASAIGDQPPAAGHQPSALRPLAEAVAHLPSCVVGPEAATRFRHGRAIECSEVSAPFVSVFHAGQLLGVAERVDALWHPVVGLCP